MGILPFLTKMGEAIEDYSKARGLDATEVAHTLEINVEKEKLTTLRFHKKYGKFLAEEGRTLSAEIVLYHAVKTMKLGIYIMVAGLIITGMGFLLFFCALPRIVSLSHPTDCFSPSHTFINPYPA